MGVGVSIKQHIPLRVGLLNVEQRVRMPLRKTKIQPAKHRVLSARAKVWGEIRILTNVQFMVMQEEKRYSPYKVALTCLRALKLRFPFMPSMLYCRASDVAISCFRIQRTTSLRCDPPMLPRKCVCSKSRDSKFYRGKNKQQHHKVEPTLAIIKASYRKTVVR